MNNTQRKILIFSAVAVAAIVGGFTLYQTGTVSNWFAGKAKANGEASQKREAPKLVELADGSVGLELSADALASLELKPQEAVLAKGELPLPPMIGTVNYDNDRLFSIKPRFTGEVSEIMSPKGGKAVKNGTGAFDVCKPTLKFGDKVEHGQVLAVLWSREIGEKKAALVDALVNLNLSKESLERQQQMYKDAVIPYAALKQAERTMQLDSNAAMTAERTLRMWKLGDAEIQAIKDKAHVIHDQKLKRDVVKEVEEWARVEIKAPEFGPKNARSDLTIVEKNTHLGDMVDPANYGLPMFRIADLSRLQIWVHPPEEDLKVLREQLQAGPGGLRWKIHFQSDSTKIHDLTVEQISPSLEPNQHTPMLIGYLDNSEYKYLVGQFVTATIMIRPPQDTVEIPTDAVNPLNGQEFVFIENPTAKNQFLIRRVSVVRSLKNTSFVRTKLTPEQKQVNEGEYPIEELKAGDRVVTRGVVELTAALEEIRNAKK